MEMLCVQKNSAVLALSLLVQVCSAGIGIMVGGPVLSRDEDDWEPVYRIYEGQEWDSHDDYLSQERGARFGDKDDSQFRSWKLDQWHHDKIQKVKVELYDDGDEVAEFEFEGTMQNLTSFFSPANLRRSSYGDIPDGLSGTRFPGDDFSFDGDDDSRHWAISSVHKGDCRNDEGWIQVIDKPTPGRDRCVCGYENVAKYPTIMYAKGNRKARWGDRNAVGHADMMQVSVSHVPYPARQQPRAPVMQQPVVMSQQPPQMMPQQPPQMMQPQPPMMQPQMVQQQPGMMPMFPQQVAMYSGDDGK
ncbi:uncharacterized protein LOC127860533 [Dreissena polymorpha]|uniref:Uncharacterized protein n=1 Tax=Dreissena polymorpha TaxID=45954 RepID=A0A9D3YV41_DREPO|nr:uncharacterized protein LOC127860533 [Dreissena polymorpha]KAH3705101.1 hypothetical protein DPMN_080166 [Dreissena polymorpha]